MATELPLAQCSLDGPGLRAQLARYEAVGRTVSEHRREPNLLTLRLDGADPALVRELIDVERGCCPMFRMEWRDPVLTVAAEDAPALDAIEYALHAG
jgi:hypothetical protein